jgi:hypothetical protein
MQIGHGRHSSGPMENENESRPIRQAPGLLVEYRRLFASECRNESPSTGSGHSTRRVQRVHILDYPKIRMACHEQAAERRMAARSGGKYELS